MDNNDIRFGIELLPNAKVYELVYYAKLSEDSGFDYVWVTDHYNNRNSFVVLSAIAINTNRVRIGTGVTNPFHVNPAVIASAISTLNEISGGRAVLGIGAGDKFTLEKIGVRREKPLKGMREAISIIRALIRGESVSFEGEIFRMSGARLEFRAGDIPIYVGAQGRKMLKLASEMGDGLILNASHPKDVKVAAEIVGKRKDFDFAVCSAFSIDKNRDVAVENAKVVVAFIISSSPKEVLERHGIDEGRAREVKEALNEAFSKGKWKELREKVSDEMVEAFSISGTPDDVVERIEEMRKLGVSQIVVGSPIGKDKAKAIRLIGKEVIPRLT